MSKIGRVVDWWGSCRWVVWCTKISNSLRNLAHRLLMLAMKVSRWNWKDVPREWPIPFLKGCYFQLKFDMEAKNDFCIANTTVDSQAEGFVNISNI